MKGSKHTGSVRSAKPYSPSVSPAPKGSYLGKTSNKCGASANKPGKTGNAFEGKKA